LTPETGIHFRAFAAEYGAIVDQVQVVIAGFPPLLRDLAEPLLPELAEGEFSHIVALLPYWVAELLDEAQSKQIDETRTLAVANLLGWWSYALQDGLLDRDLDRPELLPLATALHVTAIRLLERLLPDHNAFWDAFQRLSLTAAEAHCREQRDYRLPLTGVRDEPTLRDDADDLACLGDRSALLQLAVVAQFALHGHDQDHPLRLALAKTLRQYAIARQIGDDRTDWLEDLRQGRLNYVSTRIVHRMLETGVVQPHAELDADRMAGYFLYDDDLFADIQRVAMAACRRAAEAIAPHNSRYLDDLIARLAERLERGYEAALDSRRELRVLFSSQDKARQP
jgi:hypothetical protein